MCVSDRENNPILNEWYIILGVFIKDPEDINETNSRKIFASLDNKRTYLETNNAEGLRVGESDKCKINEIKWHNMDWMGNTMRYSP